MGAVRLYAWAGFRRRGMSWVLVTLLVATTGAGAIGCLAAARRTASAHTRYLRDTATADIELASDPHCGGEDRPCTAKDFLSIPGVIQASESVRLLAGFEDGDGHLVETAEPPAAFGLLARDPWGSNRPVVRSGRLPGADATDEVFVTEAAAQENHLSVGQSFTVRTFTMEQIDGLMAEAQGGPKVGSSIALRVTGVGAYGSGLEDGAVILAPRRVAARMSTFGHIYLLRVEGGPDRAAAVVRELDERWGLAPDGTVVSAHETAQRAMRPYITALTVYGLLAGLAGIALVGQAVRREIRAEREHAAVLAAIGMTPRQQRAGIAVRVAIAALVGCALMVVAVILTSGLAPIGPARRIEPHRGISIDVSLLTFGALAWAVAILAIAVLSTFTPRARRARQAERKRPLIPLPLVPAVALRGLRGAGTTRSSALARAAVVGVATVAFLAAAPVTFSAGLHHLLDTPRLYGVNFDGSVFLGYQTQENPPRVKAADAVRRQLADDPAVAWTSTVSSAPVKVGGIRVDAGAAPNGLLNATLTRGRAPAAPDEILLGATTMRRAHTSVGSTVRVTSGRRSATYQVVGTALFAGTLGTGAGFTPPGLRRVAPGAMTSEVGIRLTDGVTEKAKGEMAVGAQGAAQQFVMDPTVEQPEPPDEAARLQSIEKLPGALTAMLALTGLVAFGHSLLLFFWSRRREVAVTRVVGFDRHQVRIAMLAQATLLTVVGLATGLLLGVVAGRLLWRRWADDIGVLPVAITPLGVLLVAGLAALAGALAVALPAAIRVTRRTVADELRAE